MRFQGNSPMDQIKNAIGNTIYAELKDGTGYRGKLLDVDGYMNILLQSAIEYMDECPVAKYEEIYIRGSTLLYVKVDK